MLPDCWSQIYWSQDPKELLLWCVLSIDIYILNIKTDKVLKYVLISLKITSGIPTVAQWWRTRLVSMQMWVLFLALLSALRIWP